MSEKEQEVPMGEPLIIQCPVCGGSGRLTAMFPRYAPHVQSLKRKPWIELDCDFCGKRGFVSPGAIEARNAGRRHRDERIARRFGLREYANRIGISPVALSRYEQGHGDVEPEVVAIINSHKG